MVLVQKEIPKVGDVVVPIRKGPMIGFTCFCNTDAKKHSVKEVIMRYDEKEEEEYAVLVLDKFPCRALSNWVQAIESGEGDWAKRFEGVNFIW